MQAAVITAAGRCEVIAVPSPEPGPGQVRILMEGCGVCASNLEPWAGPSWMQFPTEPGGLGHEGWGHIDAIGDGVVGFRLGDRVAALSYHAYAEQDVADANAVLVLPAALDGVPFPGEPLGCAMNIFRRSDIRAGQTVAIIGIGFLGALLTRLAHDAGARVIALSRRNTALELARQQGAETCIKLDDHYAIIEKLRALTEGRFCDRVVEATGKAWPLDLAGELCRERGRLIIAGYHQDGPRQINMQLWNWRGLDVINAHERDPAVYREGMQDAIAAVQAGRIDPQPLCTDSYRLQDLGVALDATRDRPHGFVKAWIRLA
jgi:threonine dehydrogenase-like Zn-dependent dehydrogenase